MTKDHVFPRVLGGTKELSLPACLECQEVISEFELEVGRSSPYTPLLLQAGRRGRHKRRATSGLVRTTYCLAKHPLGGYGESCVRVGDDVPSPLPHIEIDVWGSRQARRRGARPEDVDLLTQKLIGMIARCDTADRLARALFARTENIAGITEDADFWPRVVLDASGKPFIRARDMHEATVFAGWLLAFLKAGGFREYSRWAHGEIKAGTEHTVQLRCRTSSLHRLSAKVAFGLAWLNYVEARSSEQALRPLRELVLTGKHEGLHVRWVSKPGHIKLFPDHHLGVVRCSGAEFRGITSFYGDCSVVKWFVPEGSLEESEPIAAMSRRDGTSTQIVSGGLVSEIL